MASTKNEGADSCTPDPDTSVRLTRSFAAPRARVFAVFLDCEALRHIWTSPDYPILDMSMDARVGGGWAFAMRMGEGGAVQHCSARYIEITPNERIVWLTSWTDGPMAGRPEMRVTLDFFEEAGGSRIEVVQEFFPDSQTRDHHAEGWSAGFAKLDAALGSGASA